jgi:hypothetical protein
MLQHCIGLRPLAKSGLNFEVSLGFTVSVAKSVAESVDQHMASGVYITGLSRVLEHVTIMWSPAFACSSVSPCRYRSGICPELGL